MKNFLENLNYAKYVIFHPFDGFYEVKFRDKGNASIATIFVLLYGLLEVISTQYTGFILNAINIKHINSLSIFVYAILPIFIFVLGNYSTTTLFDGKGLLKEIYTVIGYALIPMILTRLVGLLISQFISSDEIMIYNMIITSGTVWFGFLVFTGLVTIHDYGFFKNIVTLVFTLLAIAIILFVSLLFFSLIQQFVSFFSILFKEFVLRLEVWL